MLVFTQVLDFSSLSIIRYPFCITAYLINVIETANSGESLFALYWKREPVPRNFIKADSRPLIDFNIIEPSEDKIIVI